MLRRRGPGRDEEGRKRPFGTDLLATETALASLQDAARFPEIEIVRRAMAGWRFHHDFRTDAGSPLRRPCLAVTTPTLASDGSDDALYDQAVAIVAKDRKCSTSYIQRKLAIGYNKAARLVEQMEEQGVVSPANHVGKREVLVPEV